MSVETLIDGTVFIALVLTPFFVAALIAEALNAASSPSWASWRQGDSAQPIHFGDDDDSILFP